MNLNVVEERPPRSIQIFCVIGALVTLIALGSAVPIFEQGTTTAYISGGIVLFLGLVQGLIIVGLWMQNETAWQFAMVFYTLALLLNVLSQNLIGLVLDTVLIVFLLSVQDTYRDTDDEFDVDSLEAGPDEDNTDVPDDITKEAHEDIEDRIETLPEDKS